MTEKENKSSNNLVYIIISVVFISLLVIHVLFKISAPCEFFAAEWSAGELLTFLGTVFLGGLALWQNKKFKDENDKSQEELKTLTEKANDINDKLLDIEKEKTKPKFLVERFFGLQKANQLKKEENLKTKLGISKLKCIKNLDGNNDVNNIDYIVCYNLAIDETDEESIDKEYDVMYYEIFLKSISDSSITKIEFEKIIFRNDNKVILENEIDREIDISCEKDTEIPLIIHYFGNNLEEVQKASNLLLQLNLTMSNNEKYKTQFSIRKFFIEEKYKDAPNGKSEKMISYAYKIID